jgi:pilus assembly protein CpaE
MSLDLNLDRFEADTTPGGEALGGTPTEGGLLVVVGAKGGCGTTLVTANVAAALADDRRVVLVDLDVSKGDVAGYLDLGTNRTLNNLLERLDALDEALLNGCVEVHPSGLHVLTQPYDLANLQQPSAPEVLQLLARLRASYDLVVVDAGSRIDVATLAAATSADELVLLSTPDVPALRDARRVIKLLETIDVPLAKIRLVINKKARFGGLSDEDIKNQLGTEVAASIARNDAVCARVDAKGSLLSAEAPHAQVTKDIAELWPRLRGEIGGVASRLPWFLKRM